MKNGILLRQVINIIDEIKFTNSNEKHEFNEIYETMLKELQSAGNAGEFYTPRPVTNFMVEMINPSLKVKIADFACGTGGFLTSTLDYLKNQVKTVEDKELYDNSIYGIEKKSLPYLLCITNLLLHDIDEPNIEQLENYRYAYDVLKPLLEGYKTFDALSSIDFYEKGLVPIPVTTTDHIDAFLEKDIEERWAYYCCAQVTDVGNRFFAMPSYRNRILGLQLYKYNIKGFLQWGFNFYYKRLARGVINPYITTSAGNGFPSGDSFSVYPYNDDVIPTLRALVFREAIEDISLCRALEEYIGREKVVELIDSEAGMNVTFSQYPRNNDYILNLTDKMKRMIKELNR